MKKNFEVLPGFDAEPAAVFNDGVEDGAFAVGLAAADEERFPAETAGPHFQTSSSGSPFITFGVSTHAVGLLRTRDALIRQSTGQWRARWVGFSTTPESLNRKAASCPWPVAARRREVPGGWSWVPDERI
ncbi:MAG: hypothetical protein IAF94_17655 [Pirellulaceae bacterium]|nr:hypothetical protein [Pirellulaceae bacterium]